MPENDDPLKQFLEDLKSDLCAGKEIVNDHTAEDLSITQLAILKNALDSAVVCFTRILDPTVNPSFDPPDAGTDFTPINTSGFTLADYARTACERICQALEDYCDGLTDQAARLVRQINAIMFEYYDAAGLT